METDFEEDILQLPIGDYREGGRAHGALSRSIDSAPSSVIVLCPFRDNRLLKTALGRAAVRVYYAVSPSFARYFSSVDWLNRAARRVLDKFVQHLAGAEG